ncbi:protein TIC110, chloroplastic [Tanacetum coccineum]
MFFSCGDYDGDRKMDDLKLLYIAYIADALSGGRMEKDKMGIEMFRGYWDCLGLLQLRCLKGCWKSNTTTYNINNNYAQPSSRSLLKAATTYGRNDMDIGMAITTDGSSIELSGENLFLLENGPLEFILIPNCYFIFKNRSLSVLQDSEAVSFYSLRSRLGPLMSLVKVRAGSKVCLQKANMLFGPRFATIPFRP